MKRFPLLGLGALALLIATVPAIIMAQSAQYNFAHPAFERVWDRTDSLVLDGTVARTYFWGPNPGEPRLEPWQQAANGQRLVQYFDKSRMELNDPGANPSNPFFVTNGLLTVELISGQLQTGETRFEGRYPAYIPMSGDPGDTTTPTYAAFTGVSNTTRGNHPAQDRRGQHVTATIDHNGLVGDDAAKGNVPNTNVVYYENITQHNIPSAFWDFLNQTGKVRENGRVVERPIIQPWFYASGLPISEAYWTRSLVRGQVIDVLIQAFERRVLTFTPSNSPGFQVEMGNIGQHYYNWRYKFAGQPGQGTGTPFLTPVPGSPTVIPTAVSGSPTVGSGSPTAGTGSPTVVAGSPTAGSGSPTAVNGSPTVVSGSPTAGTTVTAGTGRTVTAVPSVSVTVVPSGTETVQPQGTVKPTTPTVIPSLGTPVGTVVP